MPEKTQKLVIDANSILGGWISDFTGSSSQTLEGPDGRYAYSTAMSPFRALRPGHIAPGENWSSLTDGSTRVNQLPVNGVVNADGEVISILRGPRLVEFGLSDETIDNHYVIAIQGATHSGHTMYSSSTNVDVMAVKDYASTTNYVLFTWEDSSDADIGLTDSTLNTSLIKTNWFSSRTGGTVAGRALTAGVPLKLWTGPDGVWYCTNAQYIAGITLVAGTPGDVTAASNVSANYAALNLGLGWRAVAGVAYQNFSAIIGHKSTSASQQRGTVRMWLWDGYSPNPNFIYDLPDNQADGIVNDNGALRVWTQGRNNTKKMWAFTGTGFRMMFESSQITAPKSPNSIETFQQAQHWTSGGALYCMLGNAFHYRTFITDGTTDADDTGMLKNFKSSMLYAGYVQGSNYKIVKMDASLTTGHRVNAELHTRLYSLPYRSDIKRITVYFSNWGSGAQLQLALFKDYNTATIGSDLDLLQKTLKFADLGALSSHTFEVNVRDVNSFRLNLKFTHSAPTDTAAIVRRIEIEYQPHDIQF